MKAVAVALYNEPVVFLGVVQGVLTALGYSGLLPGWAPVVSLAVTVPLTRHFTRADKPQQSERRRGRPTA